MQIEQMPMVRIFFEKRGRAKYTSHLDAMRTLTRSFRRSGLPFWYTQGFNPHLYMTFALPIPLGTEGLRESVDLRLTKEVEAEEVVNRVNGALPPGFRALTAAPPQMEPKEIAWADYRVALVYRDTDLAELTRQWEAFWTQPVIEVAKRTKKGDKQVDIKPLSQVLRFAAEGDTVELELRMAAGISTNIAPTLLLKAFYTRSNRLPDGVRILRTNILTGDLEAFQ